MYAKQFHVGQQLCLMNPRNVLNRLQFHNNLFIYYKVRSIAAGQIHPFVRDWDLHLSAKR